MDPAVVFAIILGIIVVLFVLDRRLKLIEAFDRAMRRAGRGAACLGSAPSWSVLLRALGEFLYTFRRAAPRRPPGNRPHPHDRWSQSRHERRDTLLVAAPSQQA
jgi:hypothetical protein